MKSSAQSQAMSIGALADRFGLATHVLRHWESMGLLQPARDANGRRRYDERDLIRVAVILRAKQAGLGLETIREVVDASTPGAQRAILLREREALHQRIEAARIALDLIDCALECEHTSFALCPHFQQFVANQVATPAPPRPSA